MSFQPCARYVAIDWYCCRDLVLLSLLYCKYVSTVTGIGAWWEATQTPSAGLPRTRPLPEEDSSFGERRIRVWFMQIARVRRLAGGVIDLGSVVYCATSSGNERVSIAYGCACVRVTERKRAHRANSNLYRTLVSSYTRRVANNRQDRPCPNYEYRPCTRKFNVV